MSTSPAVGVPRDPIKLCRTFDFSRVLRKPQMTTRRIQGRSDQAGSTSGQEDPMTIWDLVMMFVGIAFVGIMFLVIHYR
jgi:hypothetical protein